MTEDSYLGDIKNSLTLNRYLYCLANSMKYIDPNGNWIFEDEEEQRIDYFNRMDIHDVKRFGGKQ